MLRTSRIRLALGLLFSIAIFASQAATLQDARTQYHAGKLKPALEETNALLKLDPNNVPALFLKAQIQSENQRTNTAIETYKKLILIDSRHLQAYNNLAALYAQQGKLILASETLEQAIRTDPVFTTIHTNLRAIYMDMSKKHYRQALKLKPEDAPTQIASIDLGDGTDQILSEELQVVPQSIQAAINTTVARNTVTAKRTPSATKSPQPVIKAEKPEITLDVTPKQAEKKPVATAPAKQAAKAEPVTRPKPTTVAKATPKPEPKPKPKPEPKPEPKAKPQPKLETAPETAAKTDPLLEVKRSLLSWANAWSNRDAKRYVKAYVNGYTVSNKTHKDWAAGRSWNFKNKKYIKVSLSNIRIQADGKNYRVNFKQRYESNSYQDMVNKEMIFVRQGNQWKIAKESTI